MSTEAIRRIELLHALYSTHTGRQVPLDSKRQHEWFDLMTAIRDMGCEPERAVVLVANRVKKLISEKKMWATALDKWRGRQQ